MSPIESFNSLSTKVKAFVATGATLATLVGAVWAVDDRYVDQTEAIQTLEQYDLRVQTQIGQLERDAKVKDYTYLTDSYYQKKALLEKTPNDLELLDEYYNIKDRRQRLGVELGL